MKDIRRAQPLRSMFRSLRHRNYRLFFGGQLISLIGTWMQMVAESWLIYRLTHSAFLLGLAGFAGQIPGFIFSPLGGVAADRYDRRTILLVTQTSAMVLALTLSVLTLSGVIQVWHVVTLAALLGVVNSFDIPARQAFVVEMVGREDLVNAVGLNSSLFNGARMVGPAIAGALIAVVGEGWCFFANGVSYIAVITGLLMVNLPVRELPPRSRSPWVHIAEGFRYVWQTVPIRVLLVLLTLVIIMAAPYSTLMPIFADQILKGGSKGLGILMGFGGAGALAGALSLTLKRGIDGLGRWIVFSCVGFGISLICFSFSRIFWLSAFFLVPVGYCMMVQLASANTLIQTMVPDRLRGRVMAVYSMLFLGMAPFGSLLGGALAKPLGAPLTVAFGGAACVGAGFWFRKKLPLLNTLSTLLIPSLFLASFGFANTTPPLGQNPMLHFQALIEEESQLLARRKALPTSADSAVLDARIDVLDTKIYQACQTVIGPLNQHLTDLKSQGAPKDAIHEQQQKALSFLRDQWTALNNQKKLVLDTPGRKYSRELEGWIKSLERWGAEYNAEAIHQKVVSLQQSLDRHPITFSSAQRATIQTISADPNARPADIMIALRQTDPRLREWLDGSSGTEAGSIFQHQESVLGQYERFRGQFALPDTLGNDRSTDAFMKILLSLHDTGKSMSIEKELFGKEAQHDFIVPVVRSTLRGLGFSPDEVSLADAMLSDETFGALIQNRKTVDQAIQSLKDGYASMTPRMRNRISFEQYVKMVSAFYHSDASSYKNLLNLVFDGGEKVGDKVVAIKVKNPAYGELMEKLGIPYAKPIEAIVSQKAAVTCVEDAVSPPK